MKAMRAVLRAVLVVGGSVLLGASVCPTPHPPVPPLPTTDSGGCTTLPASANHSSADNSCESGEPDAEPNGSLFTAIPLGRQACSGSVQLKGRLAAADDADLFSIPSCSLPFLNPSDLTSHATQEPRLMFDGDVDTEVCLFASCDLGPTGLAACPGEVTPSTPDGDPTIVHAHLPEGMLGCCRRGAGLVVTSIACDDFSPAASGFIVIRSIAPAAGGPTPCHPSYQATFSIQPPP